MPLDDENLVDAGSLSRTRVQQREFAAATRLIAWAKEFLEGPGRTEWEMSPGAFNNIFIATFAKGTKTYRAALLLADRGYGQQAEMLNRSLFEHAVVAWWLHLCVDDESRDEVIDALSDHRAHARVLFDRAMELHPELVGDEGRVSPFGADKIAALDKQFGQYGGQWHGKSLDELVREAEQQLDERYQTLLWKFFRFVNAHNNYTLHHSALGVSDFVRWDDPDDTPVVEVGPSPKWRSSALWAATSSYGLLAVATLRQLSPDRADAFSDFFDDINRDFLVYSREQVKGVERNDPCPCGSGKKFKRCHEPWVK